MSVNTGKAAAMWISMHTADMQISGLGSEPAGRGVRSALNCIHGVAQVRMEPNMPYVTVTYDAFKVSPRQFEKAVRVMGCEVERLLVRDLRAPVGPNVPEAEAPAGAINRANDQQE